MNIRKRTWMLPNGVMNAEDVARYLHLGKNTVYQLAKTGQIASYHVGRKLRFSIEDVEAYVAATRRAPTAPPYTGGVSGLSPMQAQQQAVAASGLQAQGMGADRAFAAGAGRGAGMGPGAGFGAGAAAGAEAAAVSPYGLPNQPSANAQGMSAAAWFGRMPGDALVIAGDDAVADVLASSLNAMGQPAERLVRGSYTALVNLYAGDADAALVHLYDQRSNSYNLPYVRGLAPGESVVVYRLVSRKQGLIVRHGNPKHLNSWGSLLREGVRLSNRAKGSGARVLLDEKLRALDARSETIDGYSSHAPVASTAVSRVASGVADVAVGTSREASRNADVDFVPLQTEWIDLVVAKTAKTRAILPRLEAVLASPLFIESLSGFHLEDASKLGSIVYES